MLGPSDYVFWLAGFLAEVYVVVLAVIRRDILRYLSINLCLIAFACSTVGRFLVFHAYGFQSLQYSYFYYYSDSLLHVMVFLAIAGLYLHVFREMNVSKYIRGMTGFILCGTAFFSYLVVRQSTSHFTGRFVAELAQNLYFIGVVLTYLLWGAMLKLRETRLRVVQLVLSLGFFFSLHAAVYGLVYYFPSVQFFRLIPAWLGTWLPLSWAYTFTKVSEDARIAPARVARIRMWPSH